MPAPPAGIVPRPRLAQLLREGIDGFTTLVCAPAGSGKTALLAAELGRDGLPRVAWVSLEPGDDEPGRFWGAVLDGAARSPAPCRQGSALAALAPPVRESRDSVHAAARQRAGRARRRRSCSCSTTSTSCARASACAQLAFLLLHAPPTRCGSCSAPARTRRCRCTSCACAGGSSRSASPTSRSPRTRRRRCWRRTASTLDPRAGRRALRAHRGLGRGPAARRAEPAGPRGPGALRRGVRRRRPRRRRLPARRGARSPAAAAARASSCARRSSTASAATSRTRSPARTQARDTLATLERTNGFVIGVDSRREWFRYHRLFAKLLRTRAARELGGRAAASCTRRAARWYAEHGDGVEQALEHAVAAERLGSRGRGRRRALVRPLRARDRATRCAALVDALPVDRLERDAELAAALACAALDVGDTAAGAAAPRARRARGGRAARDRAAAAYLETMALARLYRARLEGDFDAALEAADDAARPRRPSHGGWSDDARQALVHAHARARRRCGRYRSTARGAELAARRSRSRGRRARLRRGRRRWSSSRLLDVMDAGPAAASRCASEAVELAERRGWSTIPQTACAHAALALAAFYRPASRRGRASTRTARATRSPTPIAARSTSCSRTSRRGWRGATAAPDERPARCSSASRSTHRRGGRRAVRARVDGLHARPRCCAVTGDLDGARQRRSRRSAASRGWSSAVTEARLALAAGDAGAAVEIARPRRIAPRRAHAVDRRGARASLRGDRPRRGGRARRPRRGRSSEALDAGRAQRPPLAVPRGWAPDGGPAARARSAPAPRTARSSASCSPRSRTALPARRHGRAAAGAALRARAGDPALPADDALQPRDRRRAVRHHEHGQDAPAQHLPQARRRPPARGRRARPRPTPPVSSRSLRRCSANAASPSGSGSQ